MKEGSGSIWWEEGKSQERVASSLFVCARPLAWRHLTAGGGDSLQMYPVVLPGHGANGTQCPKGSHLDIGNGWESLRGELPAAPQQHPVLVVGPNWDIEEQVEDVCSSVTVHPQDCELSQPRDWGRLSREADQERVDPPSLLTFG